MTLLISVLAAVISTLVWYTNAKARKLGLGTLVLAYWGASLMWLVDSVVEYMEVGVDFFRPSASDMLNDSFLGLSVVALGLAVWVVAMIIKDSDNVLKNALSKK